MVISKFAIQIHKIMYITSRKKGCKKHVLSWCNILVLLLFVFSTNATKAQQKMARTRYFLPDGKEITEDKLDSVNRVWGGKGFLMDHDDAHPDEMHLSPMTEDYRKKSEERKARLHQLLNAEAPQFNVTDINGKRWNSEDLRGKVLVINFWFTTCVPCLQEMPKLNAIANSYKEEEVVFIAFCRDQQSVISDFLKARPFNYHIVAASQKIATAFHVESYPTSMVIDRQGVIRFLQISGANIGKDLPEAIEKIKKT